MKKPESEVIKEVILIYYEKAKEMFTKEGTTLHEELEDFLDVGYTISGVNTEPVAPGVVAVFVTMKLWGTDGSVLHMTLSEVKGQLGELGNKKGIINIVTSPFWKDVPVQVFLNTPASRVGKNIRMAGKDTVNSLKDALNSLIEKEKKGG